MAHHFDTKERNIEKMLIIKSLSRLLVSLFIINKSLFAYVHNPSSVPTRRIQTLSCNSDESSLWSFELDSRPISVLYESKRILIIDKPPGISHHNDGEIPGIVSLIRQQQQIRLWGVHRLDRVTSGILIFAKDAEMASLLSSAFSEGMIQKVYVGLSAKRKPKKKQGWVQGSMSRSRDKSWKLNRNGKQNFAKTRFFTAKLSLPNNNNNNNEDIDNSKYTCILFRPFTGRTHQLRVAAKAMGVALLGDPIYKDGQVFESGHVSRTFLHATGIAIPALGGEDDLNLWYPPTFFL